MPYRDCDIDAVSSTRTMIIESPVIVPLDVYSFDCASKMESLS